MSFKAKLETDQHSGDKAINLYKVDYNITRSVDEMGRLTSSVVGGQIDILIRSTHDNYFFDKICASEKISSGSIIFYKRNEEGATMRELKFEHAYVASYNEVFDHTGLLGTMMLSVTLVAKVLKMVDAELGNDFFNYALNK